jgi:hypothetical protein
MQVTNFKFKPKERAKTTPPPYKVTKKKHTPSLTCALSSNFTSVHELTNVCRNGAGPVGWFFLASDSGCGRPANYVFTSPQIGITNGVTRPGQTIPSGRRINDAGDYEITWTAVPNAAAYTVLFEVPTSVDDVGNPYTRLIGSRQQVS